MTIISGHKIKRIYKKNRLQTVAEKRQEKTGEYCAIALLASSRQEADSLCNDSAE
jgi:hypothetical protein